MAETNNDKRIEEMAETMKAAGIEEMKAELVAAGYTFQAEHFEGMTYDDFTGWLQAPDDTWIEGKTFGYKMRSDWEDAKIKADNSCVEKAYAHLQKERKYQAMEAVLRQIVEWDKRFTAFPLSFMAEAKRILGEKWDENKEKVNV